MNKYLIILLFAAVIGGCSNINKQGTITYTNTSNANKNLLRKKYKSLYEQWDLIKLEMELNADKEMYKTNSVIEKYDALLSKRKEEKRQLEYLLEEIENELENGDTSTLEKVLDISVGKNVLVKELKNMSFKGVSLFKDNISYSKDTAKNMIGLNEGVNTLYLEVSYALKNSQWKIVRLQEKK
ncbi:hypothetical protein [Fusobacterium sp. PH5-44]|uniref:hypothetical protein n=1 Tax=unclassified Fusobacterium TaxID=2648384 RepID=UPI003D1EE5B9